MTDPIELDAQRIDREFRLECLRIAVSQSNEALGDSGDPEKILAAADKYAGFVLAGKAA